MGHVKVLCMGLLLNVLRFLYISILSNPWWVLPFEFVQGNPIKFNSVKDLTFKKMILG